MATVVAAVGVAALLVIAALGLRLGAATIGRHRAEAAADLSALAGAARVLEGPAVSCAFAVRIAQANGAQLTSCVATGLDILVQVRVSVSLGGIGVSAEARARAGPEGSPG